MEVHQKSKNKTTIWFSNLMPGHLSIKNHNSKRYMNPNVHWRIIYCSRDMEATYMSINRGMDKEVVHMYKGTLPSHKNNVIMAFAATWMDLETIVLCEVRQWKTNIIWYHLYVESKKKHTNELICKTEPDSQTLKNLWYQREQVRGGEGKELEFGIGICTLRYMEK